MIVFAHSKFGLVQIKGSGVKRGRIPPLPAWASFWNPGMDRVKQFGYDYYFQCSLKIARVEIPKRYPINPITYGILIFRQLRGGGLFGPDPENKVMVNGLIWNLVPVMVRVILVNLQNFRVLVILLLEIWRHKNFLSGRKRVIAIRYLPPGIEQNSKKITFYAWKHLFCHRVIPPLHFHCFQAKQKFHRFNFSRRLISKTTAATPLVNPFC